MVYADQPNRNGGGIVCDIFFSMSKSRHIFLSKTTRDSASVFELALKMVEKSEIGPTDAKLFSESS